MTRPKLALAIIPLLISAASTRGSDPAPHAAVDEGCEPAGLVELQAVVISQHPTDSGVRVIVDLALTARVPMAGARIEGWDLHDNGVPRARNVDDPLGAVAGGGARSRRYVLELDEGLDHHLLFRLTGETPAGEQESSTAYVRVNLDPSRQPERTGGLVQYRARSEGGSEP